MSDSPRAVAARYEVISNVFSLIQDRDGNLWFGT
ncbi:MAG: two-component regulator propeller domain-containing protein, partial [Acidobacteriota bacterium]